MTPILDSTNVIPSAGSKLQSAGSKQGNLENTFKEIPTKASNVEANTQSSNIPNKTDKISLTSLQHDASKSTKDDADDEEHQDSNINKTNSDNALLLNTSQQSNLESNINITTKEGDTVSLYFSQSSSSEQTYISDNGGFAYTASSTSSVSLNIAIVGDINPQERKSILNLVEKIDEIVTKFGKQETQDALNKIQELNIKSEQLSQFSFNYKQSTVQTALLAYQAVGNIDQTASATKNAVSNNTSNPVATAAELAQDVKAVAREAVDVIEQKNPFETLIGIFSQINQIRQPETIGMQKGLVDFSQFIRDVFKDQKANSDLGKQQSTMHTNPLNQQESIITPQPITQQTGPAV